MEKKKIECPSLDTTLHNFPCISHAQLMDILTAEINELRPLLLRMLRDADGFAFSQEEGGSVTQTDVIRAYDTNLPKPGGM